MQLIEDSGILDSSLFGLRKQEERKYASVIDKQVTEHARESLISLLPWNDM